MEAFPEESTNPAIPTIGNQLVIARDGLQAMLDGLGRRGYRVLGPTVRDQVIVYDDINRIEDLPVGWTDGQSGGTYRLKRRADEALFGYAVGPHSWKRFLHPPSLDLWRAERDDTGGFQVSESGAVQEKFAFVGVRACEIHAIGIQDKVFLDGRYVDSHYRRRREGLFLVAVNCSEPGGTCFCKSMDTGPEVRSGFDIALTEVSARDEHAFLVEVGSPSGALMMNDIPHRAAGQEEKDKARWIIQRASRNMGRDMGGGDTRGLLLRNLEHPRWDDVAARCLTCGNCTMVCPTCFCTSVEEQTDFAIDSAGRTRRWDSCFTTDFSYIHGGSVRSSPRSRYRQWLTHKLAAWFDQFGVSGCVGCGRCITWCPVAIDITEEVRAIRNSDEQKRSTR